MGIQVSKGNTKYVFTQATAPTGEGEVEGSLWYDTTLNVLWTYTGSAWVVVATATGGNVVLSGKMETSIVQGTWAIGADAAAVYGTNYHNATGPATGDELTYTVFLPAGTYTVQLNSKTSSDFGIAKVYIGGSLVSTFDMYSGGAVSGVTQTDTGNVVATSGVKTIRFVVDGKNGSSSNYKCYLGWLRFFRTV